MNTSSWNKGRIVGQKRPLQISHIWGIRIRLELEGKTRDLAYIFFSRLAMPVGMFYLLAYMVTRWREQRRN